MSCFLFQWVLFIWKACSLGPPGPFQALLLLALLRQDPASGLWTGLACLLPPTPLLQGLKARVFFPSTPAPDHAREGSHDTFSQLPRKHPEAAMLMHRSRCAPAPPAGQGFAPIIYCQGGARWDSWFHRGAEWHWGLKLPQSCPQTQSPASSPHPSPRPQLLMTMVTREQSPGEWMVPALHSVKHSSHGQCPWSVTVCLLSGFYFAQIHLYSKQRIKVSFIYGSFITIASLPPSLSNLGVRILRRKPWKGFLNSWVLVAVMVSELTLIRHQITLKSFWARCFKTTSSPVKCDRWILKLPKDPPLYFDQTVTTFLKIPTNWWEK